MIKVSIAGIGFVFDVDAYEAMKAYLDKVEKQYGSNPDGQEIIDDIEARIVEIILSRQSMENVVAIGMVEAVISQMGEPEVFEQESSGEPKDPGEVFPRRIYRNSDGAKLGGVCNGLATYFGADPVWFRLGIFAPLILVILTAVMHIHGGPAFFAILFAIFVILYFILWIAVPLAKTPRQKLEMRGQKITASSIERNVRNDSASMSRAAARSSSLMSEIFVIIGTVLLFCIKAILLMVGAWFGLIALTLLFGIVYSLTNSEQLLGLIYTPGFGRWLDIDMVAIQTWVSSILATIMILMGVLAVVVFSFVFKFRVNKHIYWTLGIVWALILMYVVAVSPNEIKNGREKATVETALAFLDRRGYYLEKDDQGNIAILNDTLVFAGEKIDKLAFADRVNDLFPGELHMFCSDGKSLRIRSRTGPKWIESQDVKKAHGKQYKSVVQGKSHNGSSKSTPFINSRFDEFDNINYEQWEPNDGWENPNWKDPVPINMKNKKDK